MSSTLVSAVVFAHAPYAKYLPECLESILTQSHRPVEVIVLSDGSEEIAAVVAEFRGDRTVSLIQQGDAHFFLALNGVAEKCKGECVALLDSDDLYNQDHLKVLVQLFDRYPNTGLAFDNVEYFTDSDANTIRPQHATPDEENLLISSGEARTLASTELSLQDIFTHNLITGPSSLLRKAAFVQVGGYDRNAFVIGDLHLFYRIGAYYGIRFADYVGVRKRIHSRSTTQINPHYEYGIKGLENIRDDYPDVYRRIGTKVFNKKLGRKYFRAGLFYENRGDIEQARQMYKKAMVLRKLSFRYHWEYVNSFLKS